MRVASIDLGTNSARLLIADVEDFKLDEVVRRTFITRLGEGVDHNGLLDANAVFRTVDVIKDFTKVIAGENVEKVRCIGTSSLRDAGNANDLSDIIREDFGYEVEILTGAEEARLSFLGATLNRNPNHRFLVFDVGGGSTEIVCGKKSAVEKWVSLDIGCVRLSERFIKSDPPSDEEINHLRTVLSKTLKEKLAGWKCKVDDAIGLAGTATTLAANDQKMRFYDPEKVHGYRLYRPGIRDYENKFRTLSQGEISRLPGIQPGREGVILAGTSVVLAIMESFSIESFQVSERDILDGAISDLTSET